MVEAFKYSLKACELGNMGGCVNVSMMYSKGEGTDKNPVAAKVGLWDIMQVLLVCFYCRSTEI